MNWAKDTNIDEMRRLFANDPKILIPILSDHQAHWCKNRISFAYLFNLSTHQELMLGFHHNDLFSFNADLLKDFLSTETYVYKKKYLYDLRHLEDIFDLEMMYWYKTNERLAIDVDPVVLRYWSDFREYSNTNDFTPIMRHLETCRNIKDKALTQILGFEITDAFRSYQKISDNLSEIEQYGLFTK